jgi:quercetin dioxygenase-like cupin family protein
LPSYPHPSQKRILIKQLPVVRSTAPHSDRSTPEWPGRLRKEKDFMPFYRFEELEANFLTPHLSSGKAPVIEGEYMNFCLIHKIAGTGSELHYHPNELHVFQMTGKADTIVGKDRRIIGPGTFVHVPAYARHSIKATEDGNCRYLYIKDKTWTVVGLAENEAIPEKAMTVSEVNQKYQAGELNERKAEADTSRIIIDGLHSCFYPIIESLDAPRCSARRESWVAGERLAFGFFEVPNADHEPSLTGGHETFLYVLAGKLHCQAGGESKQVAAGDIVHAPRGAACRLRVQSEYARFVAVCSTRLLENKIDNMTPEEREQSRINGTAL